MQKRVGQELFGHIFSLNTETGGTEMTTNNFGATQPQPTAGGQQRLKCVYLNPQQNYEWATAACETNFSYVCQNSQ